MTDNTSQTIKCGWRDCAQRFGSEIDMNMHVLMNHMMLLEHGEFTLNKRVVQRKRPAEQPLHYSPPVPVVPVPMFSMPAVVNPTVEMRPQPSEVRAPPAIANLPPRPPPQPRPPPPPYHEKKPDLTEMIRLMQQNVQEKPDNSAILPGTSQATAAEQTEEVAGEQNMALDPERKLSDVVDEFLERLKPMKQLGFIRPGKTVYCIVCLKYVRSFHECNWKHTPAEDRVVEMWFRRFGPEKPTGKNQLIGELHEIKAWILSEEGGIDRGDNMNF